MLSYTLLENAVFDHVKISMYFVLHLGIHLDIQVLINMLSFLLVVKLDVTHHVRLRVVCKVMLGNTHHLRALIEHLKRC